MVEHHLPTDLWRAVALALCQVAPAPRCVLTLSLVCKAARPLCTDASLLVEQLCADASDGDALQLFQARLDRCQSLAAADRLVARIVTHILKRGAYSVRSIFLAASALLGSRTYYLTGCEEAAALLFEHVVDNMGAGDLVVRLLLGAEDERWLNYNDVGVLEGLARCLVQHHDSVDRWHKDPRARQAVADMVHAINARGAVFKHLEVFNWSMELLCKAGYEEELAALLEVQDGDCRREVGDYVATFACEYALPGTLALALQRYTESYWDSNVLSPLNAVHAVRGGSVEILCTVLEWCGMSLHECEGSNELRWWSRRRTLLDLAVAHVHPEMARFILRDVVARPVRLEIAITNPQTSTCAIKIVYRGTCSRKGLLCGDKAAARDAILDEIRAALGGAW